MTASLAVAALAVAVGAVILAWASELKARRWVETCRQSAAIYEQRIFELNKEIAESARREVALKQVIDSGVFMKVGTRFGYRTRVLMVTGIFGSFVECDDVTPTRRQH